MVSKKHIEQNEPLDDNVIVTGGGNVVGGNGPINVHGEVITINTPGYTTPADIEKLRSDYLEYILFAYSKLELNGIPLPSELLSGISLDSVYTPSYARRELPLGEMSSRKYPWGNDFQENFHERVEIEEAIKHENRLVILGNPGSGKTTLLKRLAIQLANNSGGPLPIIVSLNAYTEALQRQDRNLQQFFSDYFAGVAQGIANLAPLFNDALLRGNAIVLLDGLDEGQYQSRPYLVAKIEAFAREAVANGNKVVVTSRIAGYREAPLASRDWTLYTLLDIDQSAAKQFLAKLLTAFSKEASSDPRKVQAVEVQGQMFINAINQSSSLSHLASNPFLLTILALLWWQNGSLPSGRVELYELYLRTLINTWNTTRALDNRLVGQTLDYAQSVSVLSKLALWLKEENQASGAVQEELLLEWLTNYYAGEEWNKPRGEARKSAGEFLDNIKKYSNILVEQGPGFVGFVHRSIEEHLAGRGMTQMESDELISTIKKYINEPSWNEIVVTALGIWNMQGRQEMAKEVLYSVLRMGKPGILLAQRSLEDLGEAKLGHELAEEIRNMSKS